MTTVHGRFLGLYNLLGLLSQVRPAADRHCLLLLLLLLLLLHQPHPELELRRRALALARDPFLFPWTSFPSCSSRVSPIHQSGSGTAASGSGSGTGSGSATGSGSSSSAFDVFPFLLSFLPFLLVTGAAQKSSAKRSTPSTSTPLTAAVAYNS